MKPLSRVRLFATPWTIAYQDPQSVGFSRQEHWNGLPFPYSQVQMVRESLPKKMKYTWRPEEGVGVCQAKWRKQQSCKAQPVGVWVQILDLILSWIRSHEIFHTGEGHTYCISESLCGSLCKEWLVEGKSGSSWRVVKSSLNVVGTEGLSGAAGSRVGA